MNQKRGKKRGSRAVVPVMFLLTFIVVLIGAVGFVGNAEAAQWTVTTCADCHANPPVDGTARNNPEGAVIGSHAEHVTGLGIACVTCHLDHGTDYAHRDGTIQIKDPIYGGSYNLTNPVQDNEDGTGLETCGTTNCHGSESDKWGTDLSTYDTCTKCHGEKTASPTAAQQAPGGSGYDTNGNNLESDAQVGVHQIHMTLPSGYTDVLNSAGNCNECHVVPSAVDDPGHYDSALPAEVFAGNPEKADLNSVVPSWSGTTCTVYCHGANMPKSTDNVTPPNWTDTSLLTGSPDLAGDCSKCHEAPPTGLAPHTVSHDINDCDECHTHFNDNGTLTAGANRALHINGTVEFSSACNSCHAYPPVVGDGKSDINPEGKGAHVAHINHILAVDGGALVPASDTYQNHAVCDYCHDTSLAANHNDGTVTMRGPTPLNSFAASLQFGATEAEYNGTIGSDHTVTLKTCSNMACHYQTTPEWQSY